MNEENKPRTTMYGFTSLYRDMVKTNLGKSKFAWPVLALTGFASCMAVGAVVHFLRGPGNTLTLKGENYNHFEEYDHRQYKLYPSKAVDYNTYQHPRPRF